MTEDKRSDLFQKGAKKQNFKISQLKNTQLAEILECFRNENLTVIHYWQQPNFKSFWISCYIVLQTALELLWSNFI